VATREISPRARVQLLPKFALLCSTRARGIAARQLRTGTHERPGYDPSLAPEAYEDMGVDYLADLILVHRQVRETVTRLVRSEGEVTFRELLRAIEQGSRLTDSEFLTIM
jgi:hypothetical protein